MVKNPTAFLCHASEDKPLAESLARDFQKAGIDTFFDKWSINTGQSLRQRIDQGLEGCTHFVVLLTPISVAKPWVNAEIDAAFIRKLKGQTEFLPIRFGLSSKDLPPLIAPLKAPELTAETYDEDLRDLLGDIFGISKKPPLGEKPDFAKRVTPKRTGLSQAAQRVAQLFANRSSNGRRGDPRIKVEEIIESTALTMDELAVAIDELESSRLLEPVRTIGSRPLGYGAVKPTEAFFIKLDPLFMGWDPHADAVRLAAELINSGKNHLLIARTAERLAWAPRRINPALALLIRKRAVLPCKSVDALFVSGQVNKNSRTLRFLNDNQ